MSGTASTRNDSAGILAALNTNRSEAATVSLPSFLILGPPRTGTTWLHEVLQSRALLPSPTKETRFFDLHFHKGLDWYRHHFPRNQERRVVGEVAPTYFASPLACARIVSVIPHAKLVVIFRNPVQRLVSLYRLKRAYGMHSWTLEQALERDPELMSSSLYATNLKVWQSCFAPEQLSINFFDDLISDPQSFINRICAFVGLPEFSLKEQELKQVFSTTEMTEPRLFAATRAARVIADWCKARNLDNVVHHMKKSKAFNLLVGGGAPFSSLPKDTLMKIHSMLLPETEELESMVGRDLSQWKVPPKEKPAGSTR